MQDSTNNLIIKELKPTNERNPIFIVGDIHGCAFELNKLLTSARKKIPNCQIILLGDLFTKGPDPVGVYNIINEFNALSIKGNHDWALSSSIIQSQRRGFENLQEHTKQTLYLIRHHKKAILYFLYNLPHAYFSSITPLIIKKKWDIPYNIHIVHAGIDPLAGFRHTSEKMLLTARWVKIENNHNLIDRLIPVHSTYRAEAMGKIKQGIYIADINNESNISSLTRYRWHEFYNGPDLIIFGHDAKQGLFRKTLPNGRPICIGIDTGCTYGRSLTGYFPEFDDVVSVDAERTYFDIQKNEIILKHKVQYNYKANG